MTVDGEKPTEKETEKSPQTQNKKILVDVYPKVNKGENVLIFGIWL